MSYDELLQLRQRPTGPPLTSYCEPCKSLARIIGVAHIRPVEDDRAAEGAVVASTALSCGHAKALVSRSGRLSSLPDLVA